MLRKIIVAVIAVIAAVFALANQMVVTLKLWPLPWEFDLPLYIALLVAIAVGLLIGGTAFWLSATRWRHRAHVAERRLGAAEKALNEAEARARQAEARLPEATASRQLAAIDDI